MDVHDPRNPRPVHYVAAPPNTWTLHLQQHGDLLLVVHAKDMFAQAEPVDEKNCYKGKGSFHAEPPKERDWSAGLAIYDVSHPEAPRQIGFIPVEVGACVPPAPRGSWTRARTAAWFYTRPTCSWTGRSVRSHRHARNG